MWYDASAQFSISKVETSHMGVSELSDSVFLTRKPLENYTNEFFNKAFWQAERKARRKERNDLTMTAWLNLSQSRFDNWAGAGDNTLGIETKVFLQHVFHVSRFTLRTIFDAAYGFNYIDSKRFKNQDRFKVDINSSWKISSKWSYSLSSILNSQFSTSYKGREDHTRTTTLMAPGRLDLMIGFKYKYKFFTCDIYPVGGNANFVLDRRFRHLGLNGVEKGKASKWTVGPSINMLLETDFYKKIFGVRSEYYAYTNFKKAPMMTWNTKLDIRATKFLSTTLEARLRYDKESNAEKPKNLQCFTQILVGLTYTFKNK